MLRYRIENCTLFNVLEVVGYICAALHPPLPNLLKVLRPLRPPRYENPKRRPCGPTQTFPDLVANAVYQDGFPLLVASDESLEKVGDEINMRANGDVAGQSIGGIDNLWRTNRIPIERCIHPHSGPVRQESLRPTQRLGSCSGQISCPVVPVCLLRRTR